jgi:YHS domain-containing protein
VTEEVKIKNGTCKCRHCGTRTTTNMAFKKTVDEKRYYFCNREHYLLWQAEVDEVKKSEEVFHAICDHVKFELFGYDNNQKMTEYFYTRIRDLRNGFTLNKLTLKKERSSKGGYPYPVILATFQVQHDTIMYWFRNKAFKNENQKTN